MMLLAVLHLLICSDFLALNGKKSYEFLKIEKSIKLTFEISWNFQKPFNKVFRWLYRGTEVIGYRSRQKCKKKFFEIWEKMTLFWAFGAPAGVQPSGQITNLIPPNDFSGLNYPRKLPFPEKYCIVRKSTLSSRILIIMIFWIELLTP